MLFAAPTGTVDVFVNYGVSYLLCTGVPAVQESSEAKAPKEAAWSSIFVREGTDFRACVGRVFAILARFQSLGPKPVRIPSSCHCEQKQHLQPQHSSALLVLASAAGDVTVQHGSYFMLLMFP